MYTLTDRAIKLLNRRTAKRFEDAKGRMAGFDELNVISAAKTLYRELEQDNDEVFLDLAKGQYERIEPHGDDPPSSAWLASLLLAYHPVTKYVYRHEVERKRDRTAEAVNSVNAKARQLEEAMRYWAQMTAQYADTVTDEATLKAYRDAGVTRVRWVTQKDEKVCEKCKERDGRVYDIDAVPPKAHWRCRCYVVPVSEKT